MRRLKVQLSVLLLVIDDVVWKDRFLEAIRNSHRSDIETQFGIRFFSTSRRKLSKNIIYSCKYICWSLTLWTTAKKEKILEI